LTALSILSLGTLSFLAFSKASYKEGFKCGSLHFAAASAISLACREKDFCFNAFEIFLFHSIVGHLHIGN
jgi:hypothetical protein